LKNAERVFEADAVLATDGGSFNSDIGTLVAIAAHLSVYDYWMRL